MITAGIATTADTTINTAKDITTGTTIGTTTTTRGTSAAIATTRTATEDSLRDGPVRDARTASGYSRPEWPKPPAPRALSSNDSTTSRATWMTGTTISCAIRSPGRTVNGSRERFQQETMSWPW
jgi:hypothetical protein